MSINPASLASATLPQGQLRLVALTPRDAAVHLTEALGRPISVHVLKKWRAAGTGPAFLRPGSSRAHCFYTTRDLDEWAAQLRASVGATAPSGVVVDHD